MRPKSNCPVAKTEIEEAAKTEGIAERTFYRAKRGLKNILAKRRMQPTAAGT
jgi:hypothetical protein